MSGTLRETLPALARLALAYAPARAREATLALFALDTRLASILRAASEPMLAQLRIAWWREQLRVPPERWPVGEPLLTALRSWGTAVADLEALVDGWDAMTAAAPLPASAIAALADGRGTAFASLARVLGEPAAASDAMALGRGWALADLAMRLTDAREQATARTLLATAPTAPVRLPRMLRPLTVLHALSLRSSSRDGAPDRMAMLVALRLGLIGR